LVKYSLSSKTPSLAALLFLLCLAHAAWASDWNLKDEDGAHYTLSGLNGKWVLINFWAPWCPPCLQEMPDLDALQHRHKDLQVIGVAVMYDSRQKALDIVKKLSISYPIVLGNEDTAGDFGGLVGMPTSFLYSPTGELVGQHQGILTQTEVENAIQRKPDAATLFTR
jgi:thiol-disulfide isomerase/thioredoxin